MTGREAMLDLVQLLEQRTDHEAHATELEKEAKKYVKSFRGRIKDSEWAISSEGEFEILGRGAVAISLPALEALDKLIHPWFAKEGKETQSHNHPNCRCRYCDDLRIQGAGDARMGETR